MEDAARNEGVRWLRPAVWGFYLVVGLEFLFMISPFALHFYSAYGGPLRWVTGSPSTAWLTWFFLPHISETTSPVLNGIKPVGFILAGLGLVVFLVGVIQIYGSKILRLGAVTGGLYRWVRHPQYLALSILGLGVTLIWPRFLVLLSFVSMLFVYCTLAAWEEKLCLERYGESYREYRGRTGRILPGFLNRGRSSDTDGTIRWKRGIAVYAVTIPVVLILAFGARAYSLDRISASYKDDIVVLSPTLLSSQELESALRLALTDSKASALEDVEPKLLVHVVPAGWVLPDLPLHTEAELREIGGGHHTGSEVDGRFKLLFSRPRLHDPDSKGRDIVARAHGLEPLGIIRVDLNTGNVLGWDKAPDHVVWGDIPTPLF